MDPFCLIVTCILIPKWITADSFCPSGCTCERGQSGWKSVTCTAGHFTGVPHNMDLPVKSWNLSYNKIVEIDGKATELPRGIETLDVSHNYVEKLGELPVTIRVLNASHNLLSRVPVGLPRPLTVVKMSHNHIMALHTSRICHLPHLRTLFLNNNKIRKIINSPDVLECSVEYLILSNNKMEYIQVDTFSVFKMLKSLDLSRNNIKLIETGTFYDFYALKHLSLSQNMLKSLPQKLPITEWFDISKNKIVEISEDQRSDLYPQEVFLIGQNPFHCDCRLLWLKELYDTKKYQLKFLRVDADLFVPQCDSPDWLSGEGWDTLTNEDFQCLESAESTNEKEDNKLEDLNATINMIGAHSVTVEWKLDNIKTDRSSDMVLIKIHPFGKKHLGQYYSVNVDSRKYTIKSLIPESPYVICTLVIRGKPSHSDISQYDGLCLEVTTASGRFVVTELMTAALLYAAILFVCVVSLKIIYKSMKHIVHNVYKRKCD
ncbi:leucine-rich repeats and immunoglobulin-like domains protein 3 [Gigantopelta aegis]|uniref:leucine-rich repeats and immunoglobulin-like domains protein 3 n=1 Tax=Gigantopelta aegis TaxID=1735272 RepID=UPI001B88E0DF|nr:leucine-rich repeats and immunoglobulin-like domains protein 3 [Gigantopelta aegis]XP_041359603.1 leucine-rich repeats and immunoglobulin-like domains protein 3 [Gigantopelta aegis]XP_041359610.1 leucine-rich repeats and immunoglobulin-like domains protein 3 [Gigantopelta aegis]XP_041359619.1 leucine-rich repeats and immunoglobulin-like domains protein 3 [Gigantopelta aegis]XP_041359628.1 leucine-rich repeats and immunoglobulin-like domains protein 3 [Gigantopelta aegis]XP_041359637.1 leuci